MWGNVSGGPLAGHGPPTRVCSPARIGYSSGTRVILGRRRLTVADGDHADVAQLVEHHLAKVRVAGSNPVVRSEASSAVSRCRWPARLRVTLVWFLGPGTAEWPSGLGKGLQSPVRGFDSRLRLEGG